jgi:single-stranded-DNA-specific exonuclease
MFMMQNTGIRQWQRPHFFSPTEEQKKLAQKFNVNPLIIHLLELRKISEEDEIERFLNPSLASLPDPSTMKDMDTAVSLVIKAIKSQADIVIWGDYDVDGITATCLLVKFFQKIGIHTRWNIPDRFSEGYGLNGKGIEDIRSDIQTDFPLLITVDCGISNHFEIQRAKKLGFNVIVTDHHEPPDISVNADAVLNVKQEFCKFINKDLSGVGTAFYLAAGIRSQLNSEGYFRNGDDTPNLKQYLDLVAIGTIADMVPLSWVNRILVKAGFEILSVSPSKGLSALLRSSDIGSGTITSDDISFQIAPKINAAGRMGKVDSAMDLLLCDDENKARQLAKKLTDLNLKRKKICKDILESTLILKHSVLIFNDNCIILSGDFHQGVIGIVASQLVNKYNLPVILFTLDTSKPGRTVLKGSGRSIPGVDLFGILRQSSQFLIKFGGHAMAAGMSLFAENLDLFKNRFSKILEKEISKKQKSDQFDIDAEFSIDQLFEDGVVEQLYKLEPFGVGNKRPVFSDSNACVYDCYSIGHNGHHLKLFFRCKYSNRQGMGFNLGHRKELLREHNTVRHVIYSPALNRYKNLDTWEVRLFDIF